MENAGYMFAVIASDAIGAATSGDALSVPQIVGYVMAAMIGGGAAWKVVPILLARLAVSLAGAKSEKDAIERLQGQLREQIQETATARKDANEAFKERNDSLRELGDVKAELARLTERTEAQSRTIERQNEIQERQTKLIDQLRDEIRQLKDMIHGKAI